MRQISFKPYCHFLSKLLNVQAHATAAVFFSPDRKWDAENIRRIYSKVGGAKHSDVVSIFQQLVQFKIVDGVRLP